MKKTIHVYVEAAAYGKRPDDEYGPKSQEYGDASRYLEDGKLLNSHTDA